LFYFLIIIVGTYITFLVYNTKISDNNAKSGKVPRILALSNYLKKKHPSPSRELFFPDAFKTGDFSLIVNEQNVREAINSFPAGSSPGLDGMRPQYLKDIISLSAGEAGQRALRALTKLCNFLLSGQLPSEICHLLYGASLCALHKKDGRIRPIAIGNCLRRLTSKLACLS
jgi:hypothetical protein